MAMLVAGRVGIPKFFRLKKRLEEGIIAPVTHLCVYIYIYLYGNLMGYSPIYN